MGGSRETNSTVGRVEARPQPQKRPSGVDRWAFPSLPQYLGGFL